MQSRGNPAAIERRVIPSAGECGDKDQVSRSGPPIRHRDGTASPIPAVTDSVAVGSVRPQRALAILGPTATGKTSLAVELARTIGNIELISADSMAVYRDLDIGTAKPTARERDGVTWHLLDMVDPSEEFSVAQFQSAADEAIAAITARGNVPALVGGTGLYQRAVIDDLELPGRFPEVAAQLESDAERDGVESLYARLAHADPLGASRIEPTNRRRIVRALEVTLGSGRPFSAFGPGLDQYGSSRFLQIGLAIDRVDLDLRIERRLRLQLASGFLEEVEKLVARDRPLGRTARQALGYRELIEHLEGRCTYDDAVAEIVKRTRSFARRQQRWFRRDPRITWIGATSEHVVADAVALVLG